MIIKCTSKFAVKIKIKRRIFIDLLLFINDPNMLVLLTNKLYLCFVSSFQETHDKFSITILIYLQRFQMKGIYAAHKTRIL